VLAELYILKGKDAGKYIKLGNEPFVFLGRSITNQIPIDDREVSRVHCRIEVQANGCLLRDLSSGNGTYINEERTAKEQGLKDGDLIRLGKTVIVLLVEQQVEVTDWSSFIGVGEGSEINLDIETPSGELLLTESGISGLTGSVDDSEIIPAIPVFGRAETVEVEAIGHPKEAGIEAETDLESPAPFSTEEEQALEASPGPRGKKNRASLRNLVPGYIIERKMSGSRSSSQAVIYKAFQKSLERSVAIKTLLARGESREKVARRFLKEVSRVARLPHSNIVVIHDAGRVKNFYFFVMEYLGGGSILDLVADKKPLPLSKALRITHEVAGAVSYIHKHGVIHRGINPGCVLIDTATTMGKLCGFGFAKEMEMSASDTTYLTAPLEGFSFLAPEQILGKETTARVDIYSLGATLWFMLAGQMPVKGKNHIEVSSKILKGGIASILEVNPDVPPSVAAIIDRCLSIEAEDRYETAEEVVTALAQVRMEIDPQVFGSVVSGLNEVFQESEDE
jgi:hypothetical protein